MCLSESFSDVTTFLLFSCWYFYRYLLNYQASSKCLLTLQPKGLFVQQDYCVYWFDTYNTPPCGGTKKMSQSRWSGVKSDICVYTGFNFDEEGSFGFSLEKLGFCLNRCHIFPTGFIFS